jgi:plasmid stabilization system protein ParE
LKWPVIIRPGAEADLREARDWYEIRRPGLGDDLLNEIKLAVDRLAENPGCRPVYYNDFRRLMIHRFPFKLFYRLETGRVIVFRILHSKRDHRRFL